MITVFAIYLITLTVESLAPIHHLSMGLLSLMVLMILGLLLRQLEARRLRSRPFHALRLKSRRPNTVRPICMGKEDRAMPWNVNAGKTGWMGPISPVDRSRKSLYAIIPFDLFPKKVAFGYENTEFLAKLTFYLPCIFPHTM